MDETIEPQRGRNANNELARFSIAASEQRRKRGLGSAFAATNRAPSERRLAINDGDRRHHRYDRHRCDRRHWDVRQPGRRSDRHRYDHQRYDRRRRRRSYVVHRCSTSC
jgi:hypothetical protein